MRSPFDRHRILGWMVCAATTLAASMAAAEAPPKAEEAPPAQKFLRILRDGKEPKALETAIVRYTSKGGGAAKTPRADLDKQDAEGNTPLHLAAGGGFIEVVKELLEQGASPTVENKQGLTPLHLAAKGGHREVVKLLAESAQKPAGLTVDLIGVVHVGEKEYYEKLNELFKQYDALLYELVAPPNTKVPKDAKQRTPGSAVGMMQTGMTDMLDLDYQLHYIDYHQDNFVHADMSPEQFAKKMEERGESFFQMFMKAMGQSMAKQGKSGGSNDMAILSAMFSGNRSLELKRVMAEQFEDMETQMSMFEGKDGSTIITERNKVALQVLAAQIKAGKKKIGIFYGAGHMADMEKRLLDEFGVERKGDTWLTAWDLTKIKPLPAKKPSSKKPAPTAKPSAEAKEPAGAGK